MKTKSVQGHIEECTQCSICDSTGGDVYVGLRDQLYGTPGEWKVTQCSNDDCALAWLNPKIEKESLASLYTHYYTHGGDTEFPSSLEEPGPAKRMLDGIRRLSGLDRARKKADLMYLSHLDPGRVLEVGCGDGMRLTLLSEHGWIPEGQDVDATAVENSRKSTGLTVHLGEIDTIGLEHNGYDAVVMNHVLEHVPDPRSLLVECKQLLRPDGKLVVVVPNFSGRGRSIFGPAWVGIDPPRHLYHFSPPSLKRLASLAGLPGAKIFTSAAKAEFFALSSYMIRKNIPMTKPHMLSKAARVVALLWQYVAVVENRFWTKRGDECVLIWTATGNDD